MKKVEKNSNKITLLLGIWMISIILMGISISAIAQSSSYMMRADRSTTIFNLEEYNEDAWKDTIGTETDPEELFGGEGDQEGAQSKITIRSISESEWSTYDMFTNLFDVLDSMSNEQLQLFIMQANFTEEEINEQYPDEYEVWSVLLAKWDFTTEEIEKDSDEPDEYIPVFKDPENILEIIGDYNEWIAKANPVMMMMGLDPFPVMSGEELMWQLLLEGTPIPSPFEDYLKDITEELDCDCMEVEENTLIVERTGEENYTIEIEFNDRGLQGIIEVKDENDKTIYRITSSDTVTLPFVILTIGIIITVATVSLIVWKKKKKKEMDLKQLKAADLQELKSKA